MGGAYTTPVLKSMVYPKLRAELPSMSKKVVAITGTTSGMGFIAARTCAEKGASLVLLNRQSERSASALKKLKEEFPHSSIEQIACDLQDFESVRRAAAEVKSKYPNGLNVLCNNAGVMALKDQATKDGYDVQMQTNHLSHFLLTKELLPLLETAANRDGEARIVNQSSLARRGPPLKQKYFGKNGGNLGGNGNSVVFNGARWVRYHQTKLANLVFTYALQQKLEAKGSKVKAIVAHPGLSAMNLQATTVSDGGAGNMFSNILMKWSQTPEDGACGIIYGICMPDVKSGDFLGPGAAGYTGPVQKIPREKTLTPQAQCDLLWEESEKAVGDFSI